MILPWKRGIAVAGFALVSQRCEVVATQNPRLDAANSEVDAAQLLGTDVVRSMDASISRPWDAGASADITTWGTVMGDASAWPEDVGAATFEDTPWGRVPSGGPRLRPFQVIVDVRGAPHITVGPTGTVWLTGMTPAPTRLYDGGMPDPAIAIDPEGLILARPTTRGSISVMWIEADAGGALAAWHARGPVRLGDVSWTADAEGEHVLVRFDPRGAPRWWTRLPGAQLLPGTRVEGDRASVVVSVATSAHLGGETVVGPRRVRVEFDERGAVTGLLRLGGATQSVAARALPLDDGGTILAERFETEGTIHAYDHRGALRWSRSGPLDDVLFAEDGGAFILTPGELIGMDRDGFVRWRVAHPRFARHEVIGAVPTSRGHELRWAGAAIAIRHGRILTPVRQSRNWSECYPVAPCLPG